MAGNPQVLGLLEEMLDTGRTPEETCRLCPELLPEVRLRWREFCLIDAQVEALLPGLRTPASSDPIMPRSLTAGLPQIPGYTVEAVLGRGGVGVVYKARQCSLDRPVAVKMLLAGPFASPQELGRFHRETAALAGLRHPNVVQVFDAGDVEGRPYFTMELVEGGTLAQKLAGTPQPACHAAALLSTLAGAVELAHRGGIVHRDLKPANVLLTADGTPKISDFGLARRLDGEADLTRTGVVLGTPSYMAPEQALGRADVIGPAADVYALGAILYELLTGRPPFRAESDLRTVRQVTAHEPVPPSRLNATVPRDLETVCLKCLRKEPRQRYSTAAELAADLGRFLRGEAISARPEGLAARLIRRVRRRPALSAAVAASSLLLGVVVVGGVWVAAERSADRRAKEAADAAIEQAAGQDMDEMVRWLRESSWREARASLELAKSRLGDRGSAELRRRMDQGQRDLDLALRLDAMSMTAGGGLESSVYAAEYESLFRSSGLGQPSDSPEAVAARVRASDIRDALVRALDEWASHTFDLQRRHWLDEVARLADPDPSGWRVLVSDPNVFKDEAALNKLLTTAPRPFPALPLLLAIDLRLYAEHKDPAPLLTRVQQAHPDDFWVNYRLGAALHNTNPAEAVRYYQAAVSLRPNSVIANSNLGQVLSATGRPEEALASFRRAGELAPTNSGNRVATADTLARLGRIDEAIALFRSANVEHELRAFLVRNGRAEKALDEWKSTIEAAPTDHRACYGYAELCLFLGREEEYRAARRSLLSRFGDTTDLVVAARTSWTCLLLPAEGDELRQAVALAERAAAADPRQFRYLLGYLRFAQALADYRQGRYDRTISQLRAEAPFELGPAPGLLLAMALFKDGKEAEARKTLATALVTRDWREHLACDPESWLSHILRREAEGVVLPNLSAFLKGKYEPTENDERLALLGICQATNRTLALSRLYADAFAADSHLADDPANGLRYSAARAAALAGGGVGADASGQSEEGRRHCREQARRWLREDLATWERLLDGPVAGRLRAAKAMAHWRTDPDLAGLRGSPDLAKLPAGERRDCLALWAEIDDLRNRATELNLKP